MVVMDGTASQEVEKDRTDRTGSTVFFWDIPSIPYRLPTRPKLLFLLGLGSHESFASIEFVI